MSKEDDNTRDEGESALEDDETAVIDRLTDWDGCEFCGIDETLKLVGDYWICGGCEDTLNLEILYYENEYFGGEEE